MPPKFSETPKSLRQQPREHPGKTQVDTSPPRAGGPPVPWGLFRLVVIRGVSEFWRVIVKRVLRVFVSRFCRMFHGVGGRFVGFLKGLRI